MPSLAARTLRTMLLSCLAGGWLAAPPDACAVTPASPEVQEVVEKGLAYLDENNDQRLGGKCVVALAFLKSGDKDHPRIAEAVEACREGMRNGDQGNSSTIYSCGIAIIFLSELNPRAHSDLITYYLGALERRQKANGAWGYSHEPVGDTSQTQYGALALWEAHQQGFRASPNAVSGMSDWLIRTQDPGGGWAYKGEVAPGEERVEQAQTEISLSLVSAAMGSALIAADLCGLLRAGAADEAVVGNVPEALRAANQGNDRAAPPLSPSTVNRDLLMRAIRDGDAWMDENYDVSQSRYQLYYMYALERYKSFHEVLTGNAPEEPEWYNAGYEWLKAEQRSDGSWFGNCGKEVDTGFAVLFLLRSTQQSLRRGLGEGALLSGRGLPRNLAGAKLSRGQVIVQEARTEVTQLLSLLDDEQSERLDALAEDPTAIEVGAVDERSARRLEQLVRGGEPAARLLAVRALGRTGDLDYAPTLIYALTDPDRRVVREARDGLRFISRKLQGVGLPDTFDERQRYDAIEKWKRWYLSVRPDAAISVN